VILNPTVCATSDVVIIAGFLLVGKLAEWNDGESKGGADVFFAANPYVAAMGVNDGLR
jgi:hypothetical protein